MDELRLPNTDPASPGVALPQSKRGEGEAVRNHGLPSPAAGTDEIRASDLQKLMDVVEAAVAMYNSLEQDQHMPMAPEVYNAWRGLGDALNDLGLEQI